MAPLAIPKLAVQATSAIYTPLKDLFLYIRGQRQDIKDLEDRLRTLITNLISIMSRKGGIDRSLRTSVITEKTDEYILMEADVAGIHKKYTKFVTKYATITKNLPSAVELKILPGATDLDVSKAINMIEILDDSKSKIWSLNFRKLAKLSRDIDKLSKRASDVLGRLESKNMISKTSEPNQEKLHVDGNLQVFDDYVNEVLKYLSEIGNGVGIHGPVGVGKTTVLRRLYNRLIDTKSLADENSCSRLEYVISTEYPFELGTDEKIFEKLQKEIMVQLRIDHESTNSIKENANRVSKFLRDKNYILLMDQVCYPIDLNNLGLKEDHNYGKVVIACSDTNVARHSMIDHEVEIKTLSKEDGWKLLENICGKIYDSRLRGIADRIIDGCGGITREINLVAQFMKRNPDESLWNYLKTCLHSETKFARLMRLGGLPNLHSVIYDKLDGGSKKCLLYGALFPHEHKIYPDYLIECWIAEGFIAEDAIRKLRSNRECGQAILGQLTDQYLLEWCLDKKYVKMPPNFRRLALELKYPDEEEGVIWAPSNDKEPNEETWTRVTRMSLIGCETNLPESPQCGNIYTLLLQFKPELPKLADLFFCHMEKLKVLDLTHTDIEALPSSINKLVNLVSLYLYGCNHLHKLPPEAKDLTKLEFLDICGTSIPSLPQEIGLMVKLRCLRASLHPGWCSCNSKGKEVNDREVTIPLKIISNLKVLEELSIETCLHTRGMIDMAEKLAMELASLEYLTTLHFNFPNMGSLNTFVTHSKSLKNVKTGWGTHTFRSFKISIGCHNLQHAYEYDVSEAFAERRLRCSTDEKLSSNCGELLKQACSFELIGNHHVQTMSDFDLHSVKACVVARCNRLEYIVDGYKMIEVEGIVEESSGVLQNLERLHLCELRLLKCIWEGPVVSQSLIHLTVLIVNGCPKLTKILDPALALNLPRLKHLKVEDCCEIQEIVVVSEESSNSEQVDLSNILASLERVELSNLPKVERICKGTSINWNSSKSLIIMGCSRLSNLSLTQTDAEKQASIECEERWWNPLQLPDAVKQRFRPIFRFMRESSVLGSRQEGETSTSRSPDFDQPSSNIDPVIAHLVEETAQENMLDNDYHTDDPASNMNLDNVAEGPEVDMANHDDPPALNSDSESDSSAAEDEIPKHR